MAWPYVLLRGCRLAVVLISCGCATHTDPVPHIAVPDAWVAPTPIVASTSPSSGPVTAGNAGAAPAAAGVSAQEWFRGFHSSELDSLIAQADAGSLDLQQADARIRQADARARAAGAPLLPQVDLGADSNYYAGHSAYGSAHETDSGALLSASYEIDFWGKNRAERNSAEALRRASRADRDTVALSTVTGIADTYFQLVALRQRVALAAATLGNERQLLDVVQSRRSVGLANPTEVALQRATLAGAQIRVRELEQQEAASQAALALLVGSMPGTLQIKAQALSEFSEPQITPGLPSELLARRPDVRSAEENLQSAHADLVRARAAFFPSITLTASGGVQNPAVQAALITLAGAGPTVVVGAALAQSIFDGGRLRAARREADAKQLEMIAKYRASALSALWDVELALTAIHHLDVQSDAQRESLSQSDLAVQGAMVRYRQGSGDFLTVLEAQRALFIARDQMIQYRLGRLQAEVGLCKALGGGWAQ